MGRESGEGEGEGGGREREESSNPQLDGVRRASYYSRPGTWVSVVGPAVSASVPVAGPAHRVSHDSGCCPPLSQRCTGGVHMCVCVFVCVCVCVLCSEEGI